MKSKKGDKVGKGGVRRAGWTGREGGKGENESSVKEEVMEEKVEKVAV